MTPSPPPSGEQQSPDRPAHPPAGRRIGWQYAAGFAGFVAAEGIGAFVANLVTIVATGGASADALAHPWPGLAAGLAVQAVIAVLFYRLLLPRISARPPLELQGPGAWRELGLGLAVGTGLMLTVAAVLALTGTFRVESASLNTGILVGLMVGVGAAFTEEILFRGVLLRLLDAWLGPWWGLGITSALFGAAHLFNPGGTIWGAIAIAIEAGLLLGAAYLLTRRLWLPIGLHLAWNFVEGGVLGTDVSGTSLGGPSGLMHSTLTGPVWLAGGSMGIEGSVVPVVAGLIVAVLLLRRAARLGRLGRPERQPAAARA